MTDEDLLDEVRREWKHWSGHLGLDNWRVAFEVKKLKDANLEVTWRNDGYHRAWIKVSPKQSIDFSFSDKILHEAFHLILRETTDVEAYSDKVSASALARAVETQCDVLAAIILRLHEQAECGHSRLGFQELRMAANGATANASG